MRAATPARAVPAAAITLAALLVGASGCGAPPPPGASQTTSAATTRSTSCSDQWRALGTSIKTRELSSYPSDLPSQWTALQATIAYYVGAATASDCGQPLATQRAKITALEAFADRLHPFDMAYLASQVRPTALSYLAERPPKAKKVKGHRVRPVPKKRVRAALHTLQVSAYTAFTQMASGWDEADSTDPQDATAVTTSINDLTFVAGRSSAYTACKRAIELITRAVGAGRS